MRETLRLLRGLQELDYDLYRVKDELRRLPAELARKREKIESQTHTLAEIDGKLFEIRSRVKEIEDMTTLQRQRMRKLESEAADSRGDTALLVAFQHEIRKLRRDISEAEEEGLGLVEESERINAQREELKTLIDGMEAEHSEYAANVEREIEEAQKKGQGLDKERKKRLSGSLSPEIRTQYEKLLDAREGQALAELEGRICQGCYVSVPSNIYVRLARATDLVLCPSCGRILYLPEA